MVFIGVAALIDDPRTRRNVIPSYGEYYGFIISALIVFAAFVAPEALCPDRRTGMLGLYLASPLTRGRYLAAKVAAVLGLLAVATLGPPLLMLVSFVLQDLGPDGPVEVVKLLARILLAGSLVAGVYGAVSLGVSSLTDRKAFAAGAVLLLLLVTGAITGALVDGLDAPEWLLAFNLAVVSARAGAAHLRRAGRARRHVHGAAVRGEHRVDRDRLQRAVVAVPPPGGDSMTRPRSPCRCRPGPP